MKKIAMGVVALLVIVAGGLFYVFNNLGDIVKTAIEKVGSKVAGVEVSVAHVTIDLKNGKGSIEGLTVANPKGFTSPYAIKLGAIALAINPASITKSPIEVEDITIASPQITYEIGAQGSNIDALKKNVDSLGSKDKAADQPAEASSSSSDKKATALVIDKLSITAAKVSVASPLPGMAGGVTLPDIVLKDIGKSKGGASPAAVATQVLDAISSATLKGVLSLNLSSVKDAATGSMDKLKGLLGK